MALMIIQHEVQDYGKWKAVFDLSFPMRKIFGVKRYRIYRNTENPNDLSIELEVDDVTKIAEYAESEDFRASLKQSGVIGKPTVYLQDTELA